ncbi:GNAT family N-acetyltransferase [Pseudactinotalea sp. HY158]|nr:GNAT family N-acetyltransferase [Pseudactinotalea sp. HY158]
MTRVPIESIEPSVPANSSDRSIRIRTYEERDSAPTLAIFLAAITRTAAADYTPEQVRAWARPDEREPASWHAGMAARNSFVATVGSEVAGFSDVDRHGYIDMMFVAPERQRRGVAHTLLAEAERRAREYAADELHADVSLTARPFFERHGFRVVVEQHPVRAGVELINFRMSKALDRPRPPASW